MATKENDASGSSAMRGSSGGMQSQQSGGAGSQMGSGSSGSQSSGGMGSQSGSGMGSQSSGGTGYRAGSGSGGGQSVPDPMYNLISVMYHALQGCETYEQYAQDAEQAGQQDLAQFFREALQENERRAQRGQQLLAQCVQQGQGGQGQSQAGRQLHSQGVGSQGQQGSSGSL